MNDFTEYLHAPFFIFVKGLNKLTDEEILQIFGIENFKSVTVEKEDVNGRTFYKTNFNEISLNRDSEWIQILDNFQYDLYHSEEVESTILVLSKRHDIFCCSVGDADDSYSVHYYKNGELVRKIVVEDSTYQKPEVKENFGEPIPLEEQCLKHEDGFVKILSLAESVGISLKKTSEMKFYKLLRTHKANYITTLG
jgi:hypothetical protein